MVSIMVMSVSHREEVISIKGTPMCEPTCTALELGLGIFIPMILWLDGISHDA